jgi:hypothetical protein
MFFVPLLLNQVLGWMRSQPGTTSLRAIVYMDEVFGYFPPLSNPPSKLPMLTLLKQARAYGVGIVLSTQNPVDLDYKGLSNAGTWFIGRLQTERDKGRLLDGLEGASVAAQAGFDRQELERTISALGKRVFLMNNVHDSAPELFQTRFAMSYLPGPLTRDQVKELMDPYKAQAGLITTGGRPAKAEPAAPGPGATAAAAAGAPPALSPDVPRFYIPVRGRAPRGSSLVYTPQIVGAAQVRFADTKTRIHHAQSGIWLTPITDEAIPVDWEKAEAVDLAVSDLEKEPEEEARYGDLPGVATQARSYTAWTRDLAGWLYATQALELFVSPSLEEVSQPGEEEREFRIRLRQAAHEKQDEELDRLRDKYTPKLEALEERLRRAEQAADREASQAKQAHLSTGLSIGGTLLGLFGRKKISTSAIGKAASAARGAGRSAQQQSDVARAKETVEVLEEKLKDLEAEFEEEKSALAERIDPATEVLDTVAIKPKKADITVDLVALAWAPHWVDETGVAEPAW